ncbi:MAG TPA: Nramp family divalent metal transporter [Chloroflexota bacterium]|nr:Nramp family divalent metal transporter [Chloroflexota bacterium]
MLRRWLHEEAAPGEDSSGTARAATAVLSEVSRPWYARLWPFLGPAFIASVAYIDPGNFATNIQAGARFGYTLIWTIIAANLVAMLVQTLSAKLGIATGLNLAEVCREQFPRPVVLGLWALSEVVAMATDLAEFLGAAIGFNLLFHLPLFIAGLLTGLVTFVILGLQRHGFRPLEIVISAMVGVIAVCYLVETLLDRPDWLAVGHAVVSPQLGGSEGLLLAVGIIGATVMPHVIFLHSHLMQSRVVAHTPRQRQRLFHFEIVDVILAMGLAGLVNMGMLIMAASTFFGSGHHEVGTIQEAYRTLSPLLGPAAGTVFAISLLASGLSSSTVGTMAGQVVMQGFLRWHIPVWLRRVATMLPALVVIAIGVDPTRALVISQVALSFGLPFALVPLVLFTRRRGIMGELVNHAATTVAASLATLVVLGLNLFLVYQFIAG